MLYIDKTETGSVAQKMHRARFWVNQYDSYLFHNDNFYDRIEITKKKRGEKV